MNDATKESTAFIVIVVMVITGIFGFLRFVLRGDGHITDEPDAKTVGQISRVMIDGHRYIVRDHGHRGGICHDPDCKCKEESK